MKEEDRLRLRSIYADLLGVAVNIALVLLFAVGVLYFSGLLPTRVALDEVHRYWGLSLEEYNEEFGGSYRPWGWVRDVFTADGLAHLPVAFLGLLAVTGYLRILPPLLRKRDVLYAAIVVGEVLILGLSASGVFSGG